MHDFRSVNYNVTPTLYMLGVVGAVNIERHFPGTMTSRLPCYAFGDHCAPVQTFEFWNEILQDVHACRSAELLLNFFHALQRHVPFWKPESSAQENLISMFLRWHELSRPPVLNVLRKFRVHSAIRGHNLQHVRPNIRRGTYSEMWIFFLSRGAKSAVVSLQNPITGRRLLVPVRYRQCMHPECFEGAYDPLPARCPLCRAARDDPYCDTSVAHVLLNAPQHEHRALLCSDLSYTFPNGYLTAQTALARFREKARAAPVDFPEPTRVQNAPNPLLLLSDCETRMFFTISAQYM